MVRQADPSGNPMRWYVDNGRCKGLLASKHLLRDNKAAQNSMGDSSTDFSKTATKGASIRPTSLTSVQDTSSQPGPPSSSCQIQAPTPAALYGNINDGDLMEDAPQSSLDNARSCQADKTPRTLSSSNDDGMKVYHLTFYLSVFIAEAHDGFQVILRILIRNSLSVSVIARID